MPGTVGALVCAPPRSDDAAVSNPASQPGPAAAERQRVWLGLAAFYAASFAALGLYMQFLPAWLHEVQGFDARDITVVLSAQTISRTFAGPLWSQRVDRRGRVRQMLTLLSLGSAGAFALYGVADRLLVGWVVSFVFGCLYPPMLPIADAAAVGAAHRTGFAFSRLRTVGSASFLVTIVVAGLLLDALGSGWLYPMLLGTLLATAVAARALPGLAAESAPTVVPGRGPLRALLTSPPFLLLLFASALIQGSHAIYYQLSTVHWQAHGIDKAVAAVLWAEGVLAEIVLLFFAGRLLRTLRPSTLLGIGAVAAAVRWACIAQTVSVPALLAINWLHALSFAATYLGAIRAIEQRVPEGMRGTAQGLVGATNSGLGMVLCGLLGGAAYEAWGGGGAFLSMAGFALVGGACAMGMRARPGSLVHSST